MQIEKLSLLIAFLSGMCALVYEITWMRLFTPIFGLSVYATTTVLCAFMTGLSAGSFSAPRIIAIWKSSYWVFYALTETGIAITSIIIPFLIPSITEVYVLSANVDAGKSLTDFLRFLLAALVMIPPTFLMGLTLPVLAQAVSECVGEIQTAKRIGWLYGLNTLGAALGCFLVGFILLYQYGVQATIIMTALLNLVLAAAAFFISRRDVVPQRAPIPNQNPIPQHEPAQRADDETLHPKTILLLYGIVGLTSFGYELCWFRILIYYLQSATYSFSIMLTLFLAGTALGSLTYAHFLEKRIEAGHGTSALAFVQMLIGLSAAATLHIYVQIPDIWKFLIQHFGASNWWVITVQKAVVAGMIILPSTFLMGITFPLIGRLYKCTNRIGGSLSNKADSYTIGYLYSSNTLGAILGSLLTGFLLFNWMGVQPTLMFLAAVSCTVGFFISLNAARNRKRVIIFSSFVTMIFLLVFAITPSRLLIANFERFTGKILYYKESAADITFVYEKNGIRALAFSDGRGTSSTHISHNYINRLLAYSALAMKPDATDILVISMGCGNTASAFTAFPIKRLDIVDISSGAFAASKYFETNKQVLNDVRVHKYVDDGRNFLLTTAHTYDIIQLELPSLHTDGVVNLYTHEFYKLARSKLKDKGVLSQWIDANQTGRQLSYAVLNTMLQSFPESVVWASHWAWWCTGVKQAQPVEIRYPLIHALFSSPSVATDMESVGSNLEDMLARIVSSGLLLRQTVSEKPLLTDDRTQVDFVVPKTESVSAFGGGIAYYNAPLAELFIDDWKNHNTSSLRLTEIEKFYQTNHDTKVDRCIRNLLQEFPSAILKKILRVNNTEHIFVVSGSR